MKVNESESVVLDWINSYYASERMASTVIQALCIVIGLTGNLSVLYIYIFKMKGAKRNRYFIPFLAATDAVICVVAPTFGIFISENLVVPKGHTLCISFYFCLSSLTAVASFLMLAIAVQRFRVVCRPNTKPLTICAKRMIVILLLIFGIMMSLPSFFFYGEFSFVHEVQELDNNLTFYQCAELHGNPTFEMLIIANTIGRCVGSVIVVLSMTILYILIARTVYTQFKSIKTRNIKRKGPGDKGIGESESTTFSTSSSTKQRLDSNCTALNTDSEHKEEGASWTLRKIKGNDRFEKIQKRIVCMLSREKLNSISGVTSVRTHFRAHQFTYLFMTISGVYVLTIIPTSVLMVLEAQSHAFWYDLTSVKLYSFLFLRNAYIFSSVLNPFIYSLFDGLFRKQLKKTFLKCK